ncbi:MAG: 50S ribosomal protein L18 [Ardenticatenales bacterium]|jgi:large subunit ribosomal protein L18|nr:50S ribosomal protein L18 [Ardenticatenales bacterium]
MATVSYERRISRLKRHNRVRRGLSGTPVRPRMAVFRSLKHIYAQIIDDTSGHTVASASSREAALAGDLTGQPKREQAKVIGRVAAERAKALGIDAVVFDRGGYRYHGRIQALADAAREAGLKF